MSDSPDHVATKLLFENRRLRVWEMSLEPGKVSDWHRHMQDYVFVNLAPAKIRLQVPGTPPVSRGLDEGFVEYVEVGPEGQPPHQLVNAGDTLLRQILIEFTGTSQADELSDPETNGRYL